MFRYYDRISTWLTRLLLVALIMTGAEIPFAVVYSRAVTSELLGFALYVIHIITVYVFAGLPLILMSCLVEQRLLNLLRRCRGEVIALIILSTAVAYFGLELLGRIVVGGQHSQFEKRLEIIRHAGLLGVLITAAVMARYLLWPAINWLATRHKNAFTPRLAVPAVSLLLAFIAIWTADFGFYALHLNVLNAPVGVAALVLLTLASAVSIPQLHRLVRLGGMTVIIGLIVMLPFGQWSDVHNRYFLYGHTPIAGSIAERFRDLVDFDRDGSSAWWLGGTDCAEFDTRRGPILREIPGDGVDQDCQGGDATQVENGNNEHPRGLAGCEAPIQKYSIVLITVDAMRFDVANSYIAPEITHFSQYATTFRRAYSPSTFTSYSLPSIFSAQPLSDLATSNVVMNRDQCVGPMLAEQLRRVGYRTAYYNYLYVNEAEVAGFAEKNPRVIELDPPTNGGFNGFFSAVITNQAIDYLNRHREEPLFLWLHYPDAHAPYLNPGDTKFAPGTVAKYEREIAYIDHHIGRLLNWITKQGLAGQTIAIVTSDHGEDYFFHGREGHGPDAYEETIHVPLVLWVPGCPARTVDRLVSTAQLAPTIGDLIGLSIPGKNLFEEESPIAESVVAEALYNGGAFPPRSFKRALLNGRYKLIVDVRNGGRVLFDLAADPREQVNIYRERPKAAQYLETLYQKWLDRPLPAWKRQCRFIRWQKHQDGLDSIKTTEESE